MAQRLARMAFGIEAEVLVELLKAPAQHRHFLWRHTQRLTGPQSGMDANSGYLVTIAKRNHDEIERNPAVDGRLAFGLGHQRGFAALLQVAHCAETSAFIGGGSGHAEDAKGVRRL